MKYFAVSIGVLCMVGVIGCLQSVRRDIFPPIVAHKDTVVSGSKPTSTKTSKRFNDTIFVKLNSPPENFNNSVFVAANELFDSGNFNEAKKQFISVVEQTEVPDSIRFESQFMVAECHVQQSAYVPALNNLIGLESENKLPSGVHEKVLLRLGQLYCTQNDNNKAISYFSKLKNIYPNSRFLALANCNSIK